MKHDLYKTGDAGAPELTIDGNGQVIPIAICKVCEMLVEDDVADECPGVTSKPPLGLRPRFIANEARVAEIRAAVERYEIAGKAIPLGWAREWRDLDLAGAISYLPAGVITRLEGGAVAIILDHDPAAAAPREWALDRSVLPVLTGNAKRLKDLADVVVRASEDLEKNRPIIAHASLQLGLDAVGRIQRDDSYIDLDAVAWQEVIKAVSESEWMPAEYMQNDWMSDICEYLRNGPSPKTVTMNGNQLRAALEFINPDGPRDSLQCEDELTFGIVPHIDDNGVQQPAVLCCWNGDTDGVLPLDEEGPGSVPISDGERYGFLRLTMTDDVAATCLRAATIRDAVNTAELDEQINAAMTAYANAKGK